MYSIIVVVFISLLCGVSTESLEYCFNENIANLQVSCPENHYICVTDVLIGFSFPNCPVQNVDPSCIITDSLIYTLCQALTTCSIDTHTHIRRSIPNSVCQPSNYLNLTYNCIQDISVNNFNDTIRVLEGRTDISDVDDEGVCEWSYEVLDYGGIRGGIEVLVDFYNCSFFDVCLLTHNGLCMDPLSYTVGGYNTSYVLSYDVFRFGCTFCLEVLNFTRCYRSLHPTCSWSPRPDALSSCPVSGLGVGIQAITVPDIIMYPEYVSNNSLVPCDVVNCVSNAEPKCARDGVSCVCKENFSGPYCDTPTTCISCIAQEVCITTDSGEICDACPQVCQNGGQCRSVAAGVVGDSECLCLAGFRGVHCESDLICVGNPAECCIEGGPESCRMPRVSANGIEFSGKPYQYQFSNDTIEYPDPESFLKDTLCISGAITTTYSADPLKPDQNDFSTRFDSVPRLPDISLFHSLHTKTSSVIYPWDAVWELNYKGQLLIYDIPTLLAYAYHIPEWPTKNLGVPLEFQYSQDVYIKFYEAIIEIASRYTIVSRVVAEPTFGSNIHYGYPCQDGTVIFVADTRLNFSCASNIYDQTTFIYQYGSQKSTYSCGSMVPRVCDGGFAVTETGGRGYEATPFALCFQKPTKSRVVVFEPLAASTTEVGSWPANVVPDWKCSCSRLEFSGLSDLDKNDDLICTDAFYVDPILNNQYELMNIIKSKIQPICLRIPGCVYLHEPHDEELTRPPGYNSYRGSPDLRDYHDLLFKDCSGLEPDPIIGEPEIMCDGYSEAILPNKYANDQNPNSCHTTYSKTFIQNTLHMPPYVSHYSPGHCVDSFSLQAWTFLHQVCFFACIGHKSGVHSSDLKNLQDEAQAGFKKANVQFKANIDRINVVSSRQDVLSSDIVQLQSTISQNTQLIRQRRDTEDQRYAQEYNRLGSLEENAAINDLNVHIVSRYVALQHLDRLTLAEDKYQITDGCVHLTTSKYIESQDGNNPGTNFTTLAPLPSLTDGFSPPATIPISESSSSSKLSPAAIAGIVISVLVLILIIIIVIYCMCKK